LGGSRYMSRTLAIPPHPRRSSHGEREAESHLSVGEEGERLRALRLVAFDAPLVLLEVAGEALRRGAGPFWSALGNLWLAARGQRGCWVEMLYEETTPPSPSH